MIVLASASPRRRELFGLIGYSFEVRVSSADESIASGLSPKEAVEILAKRKAEAVFLHSEEIDEMLNRLSEGWKTKRMNRVDLSLLRLAVYEIQYDDSIPDKVAVNEAVELAKIYGGDDSPAFVNAILGKIMKEQ